MSSSCTAICCNTRRKTNAIAAHIKPKTIMSRLSEPTERASASSSKPQARSHSERYHEIRHEDSCGRLPRITSWTADYPRAVEPVVQGLMCMSVYPKGRAPTLDQRLEPARKGRVQRVTGISRRNRHGRRQVMRHHDRPPVERLGQGCPNPGSTFPVQIGCILRSERTAAPPDAREVSKESRGNRHRQVLFVLAVNAEVGPQRAADEPDVVDYERVVVENANVGRRGGFEPVDQREIMTIVFMITGHVYNRPVIEMSGRPLEATKADPYVASQHDHIGVRRRRREFDEFDV